jgi:hypothetical protein
MPAETWTTEKVALLEQLIAQERSGGQAAKLLKVSRNAAIGKARRLGKTFKSQTWRPRCPAPAPPAPSRAALRLAAFDPVVARALTA